MKNILLLSLIAILAISCDVPTESRTWRARNLKNSKLMIVENCMDLPVKPGDTVCVSNSGLGYSNFEIMNRANPVLDTMQIDMLVTNGDTTVTIWECYNVRLEQLVVNP